MATCRICYDPGSEDNPLQSPCECKGTVEFIHRKCLGTWIRISSEQRCSLCGAAYITEDFMLETIYRPRSIFAERLSTKPQTLFSIFLMSYVTYLTGTWPVTTDPQDMYRFIICLMNAVPPILALVTALQGVVLVPAIHVLKDRRRYLRYLCSVHRPPPGMRTIPVLYGIAAIGSFVASFYFTIAAAIVYTTILSHVYEIHCIIVTQINRDALAYSEVI